MRSIILLFFLIFFFRANSAEFTVFEKEGYYGIKDENGQITVPPVYEKLGWSSGQNEVFDGVIGYKSGTKWGLISIRNKPLTEQKFFSLVPFKEGYIKGSIKGRFSNHLFYGLLDVKGKTMVSFNYFDLSQFEDNLLVSNYENRRQSFGIVSMENEILIPLKYKKLTFGNDFQLAATFSHTIDVYHGYSLSQRSLDSLSFDRGIIGYRAGYAGHIDANGVTDLPFQFKSIEFKEGETLGKPFPLWEVYLENELQFEQKCDSLQKTANQIWVSYLNGAQHVTLPEAATFDSKNYLIREIIAEFAIIQHSKTRKFSAIDVAGKFVISGYDSIIFSGNHFICLNNEKWTVVNSSGSQLHKVPLAKILPGTKNFFIAMKNHHWGVIDFNGDTYIRFKYDSIIVTPYHYQVKYLEKWGALDFHGNWIVHPEYNEVLSFNKIVIGRRGLGYSVFYNGQFKFKTVSQPVELYNDMMLLRSDSGKLGLLSSTGELLVKPIYDVVNLKDQFIRLKKGNYTRLISNTGKTIIGTNQKIEEVGILSEGYLSIKKNGRWGYVDETGKLRISNRYDSTNTFKEGKASVRLRGKWGFIDKEEKLVIQPYYDSFSSFYKGLAIVSLNRQYGIIDSNGKTIVEFGYKNIERLSTGNYKIENQNEHYGLVDSLGQFIIRPTYEHLLDTGDGIVVKQNEKWGYIDYSGNQIFKLKYKEVRIIKNYMLLKS